MDINITLFIFISLISGAMVFLMLCSVLYITSKLREKKEFKEDRFFAQEIAKQKKLNESSPPLKSTYKPKESDIKDIRLVNTKHKIKDETMQKIASTFTAHGYDFIEDKIIPDVGLVVKIGLAQDGSATCIWGHPLIGVWFEVYAKSNDKTYLWSNNHLFSDKSIRKDQEVKHSKNLTIHDVKIDLENISISTTDKLTKENIIDFIKNEHRKTQMKYIGIID